MAANPRRDEPERRERPDVLPPRLLFDEERPERLPPERPELLPERPELLLPFPPLFLLLPLLPFPPCDARPPILAISLLSSGSIAANPRRDEPERPELLLSERPE